MTHQISLTLQEGQQLLEIFETAANRDGLANAISKDEAYEASRNWSRYRPERGDLSWYEYRDRKLVCMDLSMQLKRMLDDEGPEDYTRMLKALRRAKNPLTVQKPNRFFEIEFAGPNSTDLIFEGAKVMKQ